MSILTRFCRVSEFVESFPTSKSRLTFFYASFIPPSRRMDTRSSLTILSRTERKSSLEIWSDVRCFRFVLPGTCLIIPATSQGRTGRWVASRVCGERTPELIDPRDGSTRMDK